MRTLIKLALVVALVLLAIPCDAQVTGFASNGVITNPTTGQIIADTGDLGNTNYRLGVLASSTVTVTLEVQIRNVTNSSTLASFNLIVPANDTRVLDIGIIATVNGQRLRIAVASGVTGSVQAALRFQ